VAIEIPALNLQITPFSSAPGITFNPAVIKFTDYSTALYNISIIVESNVSAGRYLISFKKEETLPFLYQDL
jgi:hypothetical protein